MERSALSETESEVESLELALDGLVAIRVWPRQGYSFLSWKLYDVQNLSWSSNDLFANLLASGGALKPQPHANLQSKNIDWWSDSLQYRNCTSLLEPELGEAAITGTDASGWGSGQVAWIDGGKEA